VAFFLCAVVLYTVVLYTGQGAFLQRCEVERILVIDNYDSFTHNLVQMLLHYDLDINVVRSDKIHIDQITQKMPDYILISPGPRDPVNAGVSTSVVKVFAGKIPILGVCLGMQCINEAMGGQTIKAPLPVHGKTSLVYHNSEMIFKGIPSPFVAARYHSLIVKPDSDKLNITAHADDGVIMGIAHAEFPVFGVQFHPESFMTDNGFMLIENFLKHGPLKDMKAAA
jgi:anthranilate synthase component 2